MTKAKHIVILVTAKDKNEASRIAQSLLEAQFIACATMIDAVESLFWWQGKIEASKETLLVLKAPQRLLRKIIQRVKSLHSYENPEIIALPIMGASNTYLQWIEGVVSQGRGI